jgi:hypothetical protein
MAWETRKGGGRYYTRSRREGGRVVREYVGSGPFAELVAEMDQVARDEREDRARRDRGEREREREKMEALIAPSVELGAAAEVLATAELVAAGYHEHKGEWRRERSQ